MRRSISTPSPAISACRSTMTTGRAIGHQIPLLVNLQPAGEYLGEDYHHAGGVPAVVGRTDEGGLLPHPGRADRQRQARSATIARRPRTSTREVIRPVVGSAEAACRLHQPEGQSVRQRDHEDQRDLGGVPRPLSVRTRTTPTPSRARRSCSTGRRTITPASTIRRSASTSTPSCSCAAPGRSAIPAAPRSSTCSRRPI